MIFNVPPRWTSDFSEAPSGVRLKNINAGVMELADVTDSKSVGLITRVGSSPTTGTRIQWLANPVKSRLNSDKVLFSFARGRERCDRNGHAVFLRPGVDFATTGSEITGISTSSTKLK